MSPTHIAVGVAAAAVAVQPLGTAGVPLALVGGALGGLVCDVDIRTGKLRRDTFVCRVAAAVLVACVLVADWYFDAGVVRSALSRAPAPQLAGAVLFLGTCTVGAASEHRGFAHSLVAVALWTAGVWLVCDPLAVPFAAGALSHIGLDLLNHKPVRLLFPLRHGICLGLCRADGMADRLLCAAGTLTAGVLLALPFVPMLAEALSSMGA